MTPGKKRLLSLLAVLATLLSGLGLALIGQNSAQAHGVTMTPGSRTYLCYLDARTGTGALDPTNAACKAALAESGSNALYNWFAVLDSNAGGRGPGYVPDGKLCSMRRPFPVQLHRLQRGSRRLAPDAPHLRLDDQDQAQQLGGSPRRFPGVHVQAGLCAHGAAGLG